MRRVVITGMGLVTPLGSDVDTVFQRVVNGDCAIGPISRFDTSEFRVKLAAEVKEGDMPSDFSARELKFSDRFTQFARIAARQAVRHANLDGSVLDSRRFGVILGTGIGGLETTEKAMESLRNSPAKISPFYIPMSLVNLAAGSVAIDNQAHGLCSCVVTGCAAGSSAIGDAFHRIKFGFEDVMIAGASEASITPLGVGGFMAMRALHEGDDPERASIPFDKERSGFVMGEGAGILILEELTHAMRRNAVIYAEIIGYGTSCDAFHITAPAQDGSWMAHAIADALTEAEINPSDIDYLNAHGTSTPLNDVTESKAIHLAFQEHAKLLPVSSTKSHMGHLLGACGSVEAILSIKTILEGVIPATIHTQGLDPEIDLNIVVKESQEKAVRIAMSNNLGFGGHNVSLIFKKWENR